MGARGTLTALAPSALPSSDTPKANPGLGPEASPVGPPLKSSPPRPLSSHTPVGWGHPLRAQPPPCWWGQQFVATWRPQRPKEGPGGPLNPGLRYPRLRQGHTQTLGSCVGRGAHIRVLSGEGWGQQASAPAPVWSPLHLNPTFCMASGPAVSQEGRFRSRDLGWGTEGPVMGCPHQGPLEVVQRLPHHGGCTALPTS